MRQTPLVKVVTSSLVALTLATASIGAGALIKEGAVIPPRSVVLGMPGKVVRQVTDEEMEGMRWRAAHYVERARTYLAPPQR